MIIGAGFVCLAIRYPAAKLVDTKTIKTAIIITHLALFDMWSNYIIEYNLFARKRYLK